LAAVGFFVAFVDQLSTQSSKQQCSGSRPSMASPYPRHEITGRTRTRP
jgi:hypothetical protein